MLRRHPSLSPTYHPFPYSTLFRSEHAADLRLYGADVALREAGHMGAHGAHHELPLARAPERRLAVGQDADEAGVGLDIALVDGCGPEAALDDRSEEQTSELQSLMRSSYADFCFKKKKQYSQQ